MPIFSIIKEYQIVQGSSTLCSSKNSSTRFYICSFTEREDSNSVLYPILHILTIFPTSVTMILTDRQCKAWSGRVSSQWYQVLQILVVRSSVFTLHICRENILFWKRQALLQWSAWIGWLKNSNSSSIRSFQISKFGTRSSSKILLVPCIRVYMYV